MMESRRGSRWGRRALALGAAAIIGLAALPGLAQRQEAPPSELEGVGITEHLDAAIPKDLTFKDEEGKEVALGEFFDGRRPVILTLVYFRCPMLCGLLLNGFTEGLQKLSWTPGKEFQIVTVSINPLETPTLARLKKQNQLQEYGRPEAAGGWRFLTGKEANIRALADVVGFGYRYLPETDEYAHAAGIFICTPDGRLSRYLYGVQFDPQTLRLSLLEASQGKIGSTIDQIILYCFHYDAGKGRYAPAAMNIMRAVGGLTLVVLVSVISGFWLRERGKKAKRDASGGSQP